jgi:hypothetical protein
MEKENGITVTEKPATFVPPPLVKAPVKETDPLKVREAIQISDGVYEYPEDK